jgi:hypothetical protein
VAATGASILLGIPGDPRSGPPPRATRARAVAALAIALALLAIVLMADWALRHAR